MNHSRERIQEVLEEVGRKIKARDEQALRFNFLRMLGCSDNELTHSRILAFLLDPSEHHGQGTRFLRSFLETILKHDELPRDLENAWVTTEKVIGANGRLDILLYLPDGQWIAIENKVNAQEGYEQIPRYIQSLKKRGKYTLIFLTPGGRQPQNINSGPDKERIRCASYGQLAAWLNRLQLSDRPMPDRLGAVLEQCRETWDIISNPTVEGSMTDEILEYLRDPNNFAIAREIKESVGKLESSLHDTFWAKIKELLERRLQESGHFDKWHVARTAKPDYWIGIFWKTVPVARGKFQFAVLFQGWNTEKVYYGIARGGSVKVDYDERDEKLKLRLEQDGFKHDEYYAGGKYCKPSDTSLLALSKASQDETHPLPKELANDLWSLFEKYRENLEDLNEDYPKNYPSWTEPANNAKE